MDKEWICISCLNLIDLDIHGRCSTCGSDAVDWVELPPSLLNEQSNALLVPTPIGPVFRYSHG